MEPALSAALLLLAQFCLTERVCCAVSDVVFQRRWSVLRSVDDMIERFISLLNRTLQTTYPRLELRIFTRPAGLGNDAALFSRARMVVAVHGGALSNTVVCRPGTIVVRICLDAC